jgi:glycosyltransferase involved in cell wall biosynthesis
MRIAFVIPWFGPDLKGGAEQQAWQLATRLAGRGHAVEALTTRCRSFLDDWSIDELPAGAERVQEVVVRRFDLDARDREAFERLNARLLAIARAALVPGVNPVSPDDARTWTEQNINSRALEDYLETNAAAYDAIVFIPYLYGPTLRALPRVAGNAWMMPCFHDEVYAYLPDVAHAAYAARGLLFLSEGEQELAARLFGPCVWSKGAVVGAGVEFESLDAHRDAPLPPLLAKGRFILFLGRRDPGKGLELLLRAYEAARALPGGQGLELVLAGPGSTSYDDPRAGVHDLGLVDDATRAALLWNCAALASPSANESFSRVLFEAWHCGRPAVVRQSCDATRIALEGAQGGWVAESEGDWAACIAAIAGLDEAALSIPGSAGNSYALRHADWGAVLDRFEARIDGRHQEPPFTRDPLRDPESIHQLAPNYVYGDAISNEMASIRSMLRAAGFKSSIVTRFVDPGMTGDVSIHQPGCLRAQDGLIYHHSIGSEVTASAIEHRGPKALIYHNITPAEYFGPWRPGFQVLLRSGRESLWSLAGAFPVSAGDSRFNAQELERFGFREPSVLPISVDPMAWNLPPNEAVLRELGDGRPTVLFVGRVSPNKRQDRLVEAFARLRETVDARLVIAGSAAEGDAYADSIRARVRSLGLEQHVWMIGHCTQYDLHACYRAADVFWSFSEHEGFCVPLVEAMWFDVPVVALASSAIPETLGDAGVMFRWTESDESIVALVARLLANPALRKRVVERQRARRTRYLPASLAPNLAHLVARLAASNQPAMADG